MLRAGDVRHTYTPSVAHPAGSLIRRLVDLHGRRYEDIIETIVTGTQDSFGVRRVIVIDAVRAGDELCAYLPRVIGQALAMLAATRCVPTT